MFTGCAYYNYYYNAQKYYSAAEKQRRDASDRNDRKRSSATSGYAKPIASAEKMLEYYPGSKWEDDVLLIIAKSHYRDGKLRSAAGRTDELLSRFPDSPLIEEALLFKGLSLLRLAQPDSAKEILENIFITSTNQSLIAQGHLGLGEYYLMENRPEVALPEFRSAAQASKDDDWLRGESWVKAGETLGELKRYGEAVELYDEILSEKIPRRLRFEASFQRATALRESSRPEEALLVCVELLKDGAFLDDFPMVELEAGKCLIVLGRYDEAKDGLEKLIETEKQGDITIEAQYHLGLLHWTVYQNDSLAVAALLSAKSAGRSTQVGIEADSLATEIESLVRHYKKLRFFQRMFVQLDSSRQGLKLLYSIDTIWVDSSQIAKAKVDKAKDRTSKKKGKDAKGKYRPEEARDPNDPISRMIDEAMAADPTGRANLLELEQQKADSINADSSKIVTSLPDTSRAPLDSLQLIAIDSLFHTQQNDVWLSLAELHLFDRNDFDSASFYVNTLLTSTSDSILWARGVATEAYIHKSRNDTIAYDSLYQLILDRPPDNVWKERAENALGIAIKSIPATQVEALIDSAETVWRDQGDAESARLIYLLAAEVADSGDTAAARGLLAAAYITRTEMGQDSLANLLYAEVSTKFSGTPFAKIAQKRAPKNTAKAQARISNEGVKREVSEAEDFIHPFQDDEILNENRGESTIFDADKVDEIPILITSQQVIDDYLKSYYPFEAYSEHMNGKIELSLIVRSNGEITNVVTIKSEPEGYGFEEAALQVVGLLAYRPGRKTGKPVDVRIKQTFQFKYPDN